MKKSPDDLTSEESWQKGHGLIFQYLQNHAADTPVNMSDLEPLFRAVIHGTQAGLFEAAFQLYFERIKNRQFSMFTEGSHHADQACIRAFFKQTWTEPVKEITEEANFYLMSCAATNLIYLGFINEAIDPSLKSIKWYKSREKWLEAVNTAGPLASMLIAAGRINEAFTLLEEMQECVVNTENSVVKATALTFHAYAYHLYGKDDIAKKLFEQAECTITLNKPDFLMPIPTLSSYYCKFLLDTGATEKALERSLTTFGWRHRKSWQVAIDTTSLFGSDLLVLGLVFLRLGDLTNAKVHLDKQVELFKSADEWLYLPTGLNSRAQFHIETNNFREAIKDLDEALNISIKTGAKLGEWEAYINYAQLHLKQENYEVSKKFLEKAKNLTEMEMYRFRDGEIEKIEKNLSQFSL